jgi:hypothetical protein
MIFRFQTVIDEDLFMKKTIPFFVGFVLLFAASVPVGAAEEGRWQPLFNGENLDGWEVKIRGYELGENFGDTFRVEDGKLVVRYDAYDKFDNRYGHLFHEKPFSHYRLRVEYRFVGEQVEGGAGWAVRNSGIMIHGQSPESMGKDQDFPTSIEVQLLGGTGNGERPTANVCSPGTNFVMDGKLIKRHCNRSTSKTYPLDEWVMVEIEVRGNEVIRHFVNGEKVFEYTQPQLDPNDATAKKLIEQRGGEIMLDGGTISLQSESHPVEFRRVEIMELQE